MRTTNEMTRTISTVLGDVEVASLGKTLMHEHVFTFHSDMAGDYPWREEQRYIDGAVDKLKRLKDVGYDTIVDLTVPGLGRDVRRVAGVAERAGVNVIAATGVYAYKEMPLYFRRGLDVEGPTYVEDFYVREIVEGIGETGIRASIVKCVTDVAGMVTDVEILVRAAAKAHLRTGVPISTHTHAISETGLLQQRIFRELGVDLREVVIGHCDCTTDIAYVQRIIEAGSYAGFDRIGIYKTWDLEGRLEMIAELCRRGFADRMVLSHDTNCGGDFDPEVAHANWRYGEIPTVVIPALLERGVREDDINLMLVENPRRIFETAADHAAALTGGSDE